MRSKIHNSPLPPLTLRGGATWANVYQMPPLGLRGGWGSYSKINNRGVTLIELLIVISVIVILIVALGMSFQGWIGKYRVESQVKEMYIDFMNARARAMERNRVHFVTGTSTTYSVYEDTSPGPDGNAALETGSDALLRTFPKTVQYPIVWTEVGTEIDFNRNGMIDLADPETEGATSGSIFLTTTNDADSDCLNISPTKIYMGKKNATTALCESR
jgi:prepilin-type N-terminal cleavage/methylation domain-containing protein